MNKTSWMFAALFVCGVLSATLAERKVDPRLKEFATLKRRQMEELAAKLRLNVPVEAREFFRAADAGDWDAVSNSFARIFSPEAGGFVVPGFTNVLYEPVLALFGAYEQFQGWDGAMITKFADGILRSLPAGSIYIGGAGPGHHIIPAIRDVANSPDIFIIPESTGVDSLQMNYVRLLYGSRIWLPSDQDVQQAFQQYVQELHTAQKKRASGAMAKTQILTEMIFNHNKTQHEFFVEDSFAIPWMQAYLEPHGLILKLNKEPRAHLDPAVVAQDRQFWDTLTNELLADRRFTDSQPARNTYAQLRQITGNMYAYRRMTNEAEAAFKQALELGPTTIGPAWRLAYFYSEAGRFDEALTVLEQFQSRLSVTDEWRQRTAEIIAQIRERKCQANPPGQSK
jgi:hypothetical protein